MISSHTRRGLDTAPKTAPIFPIGSLVPLVLVISLFFLWGVPNNLNDVLIRQFMKSFAISRFEAGLVQSAFYLGYFIFALPAALLMNRFGYKSGFLVGLILFGGGCFLFWPAAVIDRYGFFLAALFVIASGLAFLETAANPFAAQMGDPESSERRLNFCQAFNPIGSIAGVLIGTIFIFSGIELQQTQVAVLVSQHKYSTYLHVETLRVVKPYLYLSAFALLLAVLIWRVRFPQTVEEEHRDGEDFSHFSGLRGRPHFWWAVLAQFMYVGAQVGTWSYFIQYVQEYIHQPEKIAGYFLTGTLGAFCLGRFSSTLVMKHIAPRAVLGLWSLVNVVLVTVGILVPGWTGVWAIFLTSFFMSVMYPTIFALGIKGLGPSTKIGGSLIVMGISGGAVLTPLMGYLTERTHHVADGYVVPLVAYAIVGVYALCGAYKLNDRRAGNRLDPS